MEREASRAGSAAPPGTAAGGPHRGDTQAPAPAPRGSTITAAIAATVTAPAVDGISSGVPDPHQWRALVFDRVHRVIAWLSAGSVGLMVWASITHRPALWLTPPMIAVALLYVARGRVTFQQRAAAFTLLTFAISACTLLVFGMVPGVPIMFLLAAVLGAVWVGPRFALCVMAASVATISVVNGLRATGVWSMPVHALGDPNRLENVVRTAIVYAVLGVVIVGLIGYAISTADRYALQRAAALARLQAEIEQRAAALAAQHNAEQALVQSQKLELVGRMASGVSHDFNNALTVILAWTDILKRSPADLDDGLEAIRHAALSSAQMTRRLLVLGRHTPHALSAVELDAHIEELGRMLGRILPENITLRVHSDGVPVVMADAGELDQAVLNLALNARDAMPEGGTLEIRAVRGAPLGEPGSDRWVGLRVTDSGVGMDATTRSHLFEPFFTTKGDRGTGLGLTSVRAIVDALGGTVEVDSEPGRGTAITIWLPARLGAAVPGITPLGTPVVRKATILLVEDDAALRRVMVAALKTAGHDVLEAGSVEAALEIARRMRGDIQLLCTDGVMPGGAVGHLVRSFRELYPKAAVLLCSGYLSPELPALEALGASFLAKPFDSLTLLHRIGELLAAQPRAASLPPSA